MQPDRRDLTYPDKSQKRTKLSINEWYSVSDCANLRPSGVVSKPPLPPLDPPKLDHAADERLCGGVAIRGLHTARPVTGLDDTELHPEKSFI